VLRGYCETGEDEAKKDAGKSEASPTRKCYTTVSCTFYATLATHRLPQRTRSMNRYVFSGPALAGAGPNAKLRRRAPLSSALLRHRAQSTVPRPF